MSAFSFGSNRASGFRFIAAAFVLLMLTEITSFGQSRARIVRSPGCPYLDDRMDLEISGLRRAGKEDAELLVNRCVTERNRA